MKRVKELRRKPGNGDTPGVCAGLSDYFNIDVVIIRVIFILGFLCAGGFGLVYLILWMVMSEE